MKTENLSTLKIHKISEEKYKRERDAGRLEENALYLTPDEEPCFVKYVEQDLSEEQKVQARENIGAASVDDIPVYTKTVTKTGDAVTVKPLKDTTIGVVTNIDEDYVTTWDSNYSSGVSYSLQLHQINSPNIFDFISYFGGPGPVENDKGSVVINEDGTVSVDIVDTTGSYVNILGNINNDANRYNTHVYPAGTYTLSPRMLIQGVVSTAPWTSFGNKSGTFTMDVPFMITGAILSDINLTAPTTYSMWMVRGVTSPSDYTYSGNTYVRSFNEKVPSAGTFDWQSGELKDSDGNVVQTVERHEPFPVLDGPNTFLTFAGESAISYQRLWSPDDASTGSSSGSSESFDPTAYGLPILYLNGNTASMTKDNAVTLDYIYGDKTGTATVKWQGSGSIAYPKKNYTIKFDNAFEAADGWGVHNKYCLKADWVDSSHCRNVVSAKLWGEMVKSRPNVDTRLKSLVNGGAIDGFPCFVVINDKWQGIYNFNIPKDSWMMGMGSGEKEAILCNDQGPNSSLKSEVTIGNTDNVDLELEYNSDTFTQTEVQQSFNRMIRAVLSSDGTDIDTVVSQYLDIDSVIDYYIFSVASMNLDGLSKNVIFATYDGIKWFMSAYDLDSTWGINWDGKSFHYSGYVVGDERSTEYPFYVMPYRLSVFDLVYKYRKPELISRYNALRERILSPSNVAFVFRNYAKNMPYAAIVADNKLWPTIPSTNANRVEQAVNWYNDRAEHMDDEINMIKFGITWAATEGLAYQSWGHPSYGQRTRITGIGTSSETNIVIPKWIESPEFYSGYALVEEIATDAFNATKTNNNNNNNIERVIIPEGVKKIAERALANITTLKEIDISNTVTELGAGVFYNTGIEEIVIPESVTKLGSWGVFGICASLKTATIKGPITTLTGTAFQHCKALERVYLPNTIRHIGNECFTECWALSKIILPKSLVEIGEYVFSGCRSLNKIVIPKNVKTIGLSAFAKGWSRHTIIFKGTPESIGEKAFTEMGTSITDGTPVSIYVPWSEGEVAGAPWGAPDNVTIHYNTDTSTMN